MGKRPISRNRAPDAPVPAGRRPRPDIVQTSLYLPRAVHEALREIAFHDRSKIHDFVMQAIDSALKRRGYPSIDDLKAGKRR